MKKSLNLLVLLLSFYAFSQQADIWSGNYLIKSADLTPIDTFRVVKIADADPDKVAARLAIDVNRWNIFSKSDDYKEKITARNFFYDTEEKENEYDQFGWTNLFLKGKIKCLDAGHLFLCQTTPETKIKVSNEEDFYTESGIFGVRLHYGLIKLEKIKE